LKEKSYKIAVLLTCYNRRKQTIHCLRSLFTATSSSKYEINVFLTDDGSTDGTGEEIKKQYPQVNIIQGSGNLYWNRGMNLAWETASKRFNYDFFLWLNDDVSLFEESFNILFEHVKDQNQSNSIFVGACQSVEGKVSYSGYKNRKMVIPNGNSQLCDSFNGNVVLIPFSVFKQIGFLDPIFHHAQGDFDYGLRAKEKGISSFVCSNYVGICDRNNELPKWCNPKYSFIVRLKNFYSPLGGRPKLTFIFQRKHHGILLATFHYLTIHLRLLFPRLWKIEVN